MDALARLFIEAAGQGRHPVWIVEADGTRTPHVGADGRQAMAIVPLEIVIVDPTPEAPTA